MITLFLSLPLGPNLVRLSLGIKVDFQIWEFRRCELPHDMPRVNVGEVACNNGSFKNSQCSLLLSLLLDC